MYKAIAFEMPDFVLAGEKIKNAGAIVTLQRRYSAQTMRVKIPIGTEDFKTIIHLNQQGGDGFQIRPLENQPLDSSWVTVTNEAFSFNGYVI